MPKKECADCGMTFRATFQQNRHKEQGRCEAIKELKVILNQSVDDIELLHVGNTGLRRKIKEIGRLFENPKRNDKNYSTYYDYYAASMHVKKARRHYLVGYTNPNGRNIQKLRLRDRSGSYCLVQGSSAELYKIENSKRARRRSIFLRYNYQRQRSFRGQTKYQETILFNRDGNRVGRRTTLRAIDDADIKKTLEKNKMLCSL